MALVCGRAGRLTAKNGDFRPGQVDPETYEKELGPKYKRMLGLAIATDFILEGSSGKDHDQSGVSRYDASYFGANLCIISITALAMLQNEDDPDKAATEKLQK